MGGQGPVFYMIEQQIFVCNRSRKNILIMKNSLFLVYTVISKNLRPEFFPAIISNFIFMDNIFVNEQPTVTRDLI